MRDLKRNNVRKYKARLQENYRDPENIGEKDIPANSRNAITGEKIPNGTNMVNFQNEYTQGRYYTKNSFNKIPFTQKYKKNPQNQSNITKNTVKKWKAKVSVQANTNGNRSTNTRRNNSRNNNSNSNSNSNSNNNSSPGLFGFLPRIKNPFI